MKKEKDELLFKTKMLLMSLIAVEVVMFFIPLNSGITGRYSLLQICMNLGSDGFWLSFINLRVKAVFILTVIAVTANFVTAAILYFVKSRELFKTMAISVYLFSCAVFAFNWGTLIDYAGIVKTLYGINFISLICTLIIVVFSLKVNPVPQVKEGL